MCPRAYNIVDILNSNCNAPLYYSCRSLSRLVVEISGLCYSKIGDCSKEGHSKKVNMKIVVRITIFNMIEYIRVYLYKY
jgi:hypothetical protein